MIQDMPGDPRPAVERMLGPAEPELGCDDCFDLLDSYVELELAGTAADAQMPLMRAHLQGCSACREDHDSLLALLMAEKR
jgi:hypothetical protein